MHEESDRFIAINFPDVMAVAQACAEHMRDVDGIVSIGFVRRGTRQLCLLV